jgi:hypothetical protein
MKLLRVAALAAAGLLTAIAADQPAKTSEKDQGASQAASKSRHWPRVRFGGFALGAGYAHFSGRPYPYYGYYGYPYFSAYSPYYYDPFLFTPLHPGWFAGYAYAPGMGEVKLRTADKDALVYLDGALAGPAAKLKSMWLDPGAYNLEVRSGDRVFTQRIYVLSGKSLKIAATPKAGGSPR